MKIALVGGTGMVGSRVLAEALGRGHEVTVVSRTPATDLPAGATARTADATTAGTVAALAGDHDVVVSAMAPDRLPGGHPETFPDVVRRLAAEATATGGTRLVVVGGAGSLHVGDGLLVDHPDFPAEWKPEAQAAARALDVLREQPADVDWTFLSPSPMIAPGERTGRYTTALDAPAGDSVSAEDFAVALVDELEQPQHRRQRFTVASDAALA